VSAITPLGSTPHQVANATPIPTTAAVSATGSHVCAVLRSISDIIPPTHRPVARRRPQPWRNSLPARCWQAAGGFESREAIYAVARLSGTQNSRSSATYLQEWSHCGFRVTLIGLWSARRFGSGNGPSERTFCLSCASSRPRGRACWRKWKRPGVPHRAASFISKMRIPLTICFGTRLIRGR
jgi:hypothetical protein